eukprot:360579-Chlamydomonas_euryale.AAC.3
MPSQFLPVAGDVPHRGASPDVLGPTPQAAGPPQRRVVRFLGSPCPAILEDSVAHELAVSLTYYSPT